MTSADAYRDLAESAWSWVLRHVRDDDGPWLPESVTDRWEESGPADDRDSFYAGIAGLAPVLVEIAQHRSLTEDERALAAGVVTRLSAAVTTRIEPSLYDGLGGDATALKLLSPGSEQQALHRLFELRTPAGWRTTMEWEPAPGEPVNDVVLGTAGIVLAALWAGGREAEAVATTGAQALLDTADRTEAGLDWAMQPGREGRMPNYSHGTAGVAAALAVAGTALDRADYVDAAVQGARHLLAVGSLDNGGFVVPHTFPRSTWYEDPVTYTWCHGPTGTSYLFAALAHAGVHDVEGIPVTELRNRCLHAVLTAGVPQRLRPGFWDNDGRCCGTAGVGEALLDAFQDDPESAAAASFLAGARTMGDAVVERATVDDSGARWQFVEHRQEPPLLPPGTTWMQGAAGIAAFLFRLARVERDGPGAPVVDRPDQWWAVPRELRVAVPRTGAS